MSRTATEFPIWLFGTSTNEGAEPIEFNRAMADKILHDQAARTYVPIVLASEAASVDLRAALGWAKLEIRPDGLWAMHVQWLEDGERAARELRYAVCACEFADPLGAGRVRLLSIFLTSTPLPGVSRPIPVFIDGRWVTTAESEPAVPATPAARENTILPETKKAVCDKTACGG